MNEIRLADSVTLAKYAIDKDLLNENGWKWARIKEKNPKKFERLARIFKSQVKDLKARFKYGIQIPRGYKEAMELDKKNGDTKWMDAINREKNQLFDYETFKVLDRGEKAPKEYKRIPGFYVFDVKHDLRRKARFVAGGHMTTAPKEDTYSGVVDHESVRLGLFLSELNGLKVMAADVGNAYLHAETRQKVYIIAGPEFDPELEGRVMIIVKSLYGLTTSTARWHEVLSRTLRSMGFYPTKADSDLWMKDCGTHYEYICTWVDDIIVSSLDPEALLLKFKTRAKYTLKGVGEPRYYLGGDYGRVKNPSLPNKSKSTTYLSAKTYIENICKKIEKTLDTNLKGYSMQMCPDYRPEIDDSELISPEMASKYKMLVGSTL